MYYLYILYSSEADKYYVGQSEDPWRREREHNSEGHMTYTRKYSSWELKAVFRVNGDRGDARRIENLIKKQKSRVLIEKMLKLDFIPVGVLAPLVRVPQVRD